MKEFKNITEILDFAIGEEQAAVDFYLLLGAQSKSAESKRSSTNLQRKKCATRQTLLKSRKTEPFV